MTFKKDCQLFLSHIIERSPYHIFPDRVERKFDNKFFKRILSDFEKDFSRYHPKKFPDIESLSGNPVLIGIFCYRISRVFYLEQNEEQALFYNNLIRFVSQMEIYYSADIGPGLKINHGLGLVIGAHCKIGKNALIYQQTVIGDINPLSPQREKRPIIGNNLIMYTGAKILGPVVVKDNVLISQNEICTEDIRENHILINGKTHKR